MNIENLQGHAQGIQSLYKINSVYAFVLCLLMFVFGWDFIWLCSKVLQSLEVGLSRFYSPGISQATGQRRMVAWRVSTVWSCSLAPPSVFQAYSSLGLFSCPQLPYSPLLCLGRIPLSQSTSYGATGTAGAVMHSPSTRCTSLIFCLLL